MNTTRRWSGLAGLLMSLAVTGCSNLTVAVDVLDPAYVRDAMFDERLHKKYAEIVKAQPGELKAQVMLRNREFAGRLVALINKMEEVAKLLNDAGLLANIRHLKSEFDPGSAWDKEMQVSGDALEQIARQTRQTGSQLAYRSRDPMPLALRRQLEAFDAELATESRRRDGPYRLVEKDLRVAVRRAVEKERRDAASSICSPPPGMRCSPDLQNAAMVAGDKAAAAAELKYKVAEVQQQVERVEEARTAELRSIIGDGSLASSEYAYTVASAPDRLWRRGFNRAYASGMMGSSDMVIRLNSTADFSVKGMLFDASTVASVASKVTTQALLLGVQMAGVPVPTAGTGSTGGDALSTSSAALATSEATLAKRRAAAAAQKEAIRSLAQSLLSVSSALEGELKDKDDQDDKRKALHSNIDSSMSALRSLLAMDSLQ
jgi:hypothetical protein